MISKHTFGQLQDETEINIYTLSNANGIEVKIMNLGGIIVSLKTPNKDGIFEDIVLGFDSLKEYFHNNSYFGAIAGRYANRIALGKFTLAGNTYSLAQNNLGNHLHGGIKGFDTVYWYIEENPLANGDSSIILKYTSPDMEEGYPGNLKVEVIYTLTKEDELKIDYSAKTDKTTLVNLTQHSYFNLSGKQESTVLDHQVVLNADRFIPIDHTFIPTGLIESVEGTPFDFRKPKIIAENIEDNNEQLGYANGYDHCWVLNGGENEMKFAGAAFESASGRSIDVYTTEPGMQFYSGNFLDGSIKGKNGVDYVKNAGFCFETSHYPDSPNNLQFPSVELHPEKMYKTSTIFKFNKAKSF